MNNKKNLGFIGVGHMGTGMVKNLLKSFNVYIIAHKNRKPIDELKKIGAKEFGSYDELCSLNLDCLILCVTNTPIAITIAKNIAITPSDIKSLLTVGPTYSNLLYSIPSAKALFKTPFKASTAIC